MAANLELELEQAEVGRARERRLPFAFAKRHGVLIQGLKDGHTEAVYRQGVSILSLAEVRRFVDSPVKFSCVDSETFDDQLQTAYESGAAMTMMEGLDDETDLLEVAQQLPEPSDLLESDDEAPIIRLISSGSRKTSWKGSCSGSASAMPPSTCGIRSRPTMSSNPNTPVLGMPMGLPTTASASSMVKSSSMALTTPH